MTRYVATINVPGYLPMDDGSPLLWEDEDGLTVPSDEPGKLLKGMVYALAIQAAVVVLVAALVVLVVVAGRAL